MRVCFIWKDIAEIGGVGSWVRQCLHALPALGIQADALDIDPTHSGDALPHVMRVSFGKWDSPSIQESRLRRAINRLNPDVLVFNEQAYASDILAATGGRIPAVNVVHSDRDSAYPYMEELVRAGVPALCVSRVIQEKLRACLPDEYKDQVHYSLLGVDLPDRPHGAPWKPGLPLRLVYAGRLQRYQKRIEDLPLFLRSLVRAGIEFHADIAGAGSEETLLLDQLRENGLGERVTFHGALSHADTLSLFERSHIFMLFSTFEGLPLALLEAMARGVVPVVTDLPSGISEVVQDHVNGRLFPVGEPAAAAELISELSQSKTSLARMRNAAIETASAYSFAKQIHQFIDLFKEAARSPLPTPLSGRETGLRRIVPKRWLELRDGREAESNQEQRTKNPNARPCP